MGSSFDPVFAGILILFFFFFLRCESIIYEKKNVSPKILLTFLFLEEINFVFLCFLNQSLLKKIAE